MLGKDALVLLAIILAEVGHPVKNFQDEAVLWLFLWLALEEELAEGVDVRDGEPPYAVAVVGIEIGALYDAKEGLEGSGIDLLGMARIDGLEKRLSMRSASGLMVEKRRRGSRSWRSSSMTQGLLVMTRRRKSQ